MKAINLQKKTDKCLIQIKEEFKIGDYLNSKDIILFDISYSEFWLEVEMCLTSQDKRPMKISFDLKIRNNDLISSLKKILIKMGIRSWKKYIRGSEEDPDYYLLTDFMFIQAQDLRRSSSRSFVLNNIEEEMENFQGIFLMKFINENFFRKG